MDSRSTLLVARSKAALKKSIYLIKRVLFMQECVDDEEVQLYSCHGPLNLADPFTKAILQPTPFFKTKAYYILGRGSVKHNEAMESLD